jgi:hypothetical protein
MRLGSLFVWFLVLCACVHPVREQRAEITTTDYLLFPMTDADRAAAVDILQRLKTAIRTDDPRRIADIIYYPFYLNGSSIGDASEFVLQYQTAVGPRLRASILALTSDRLESTANGIVFGSGELWISAVCPGRARFGECADGAAKRYLITRVNDKR